jgi:hypothetical protein
MTGTQPMRALRRIVCPVWAGAGVLPRMAMLGVQPSEPQVSHPLKSAIRVARRSGLGLRGPNCARAVLRPRELQDKPLANLCPILGL